MKVVEVTLRSSRDDEDVNGTFVLEKKRGDTWTRQEGYDVTSGTEAASRRFLLADDERIVVEGRPTESIIYDADQRAAIRLPTDAEERENKRRAEAAITAEQNRIAEERTRRDAAIARGEVAPPHVSEPPEGVKKAQPMDTAPDPKKLEAIKKREGAEDRASVPPRQGGPEARGVSSSAPPPGIAAGGARSSKDVKSGG